MLIEGLTQNYDFFTLLLQNDEIKEEAFGVFADEIRRLREQKMTPKWRYFHVFKAI